MSAKKTAFYGMFLALALVAGYIEQLIPVNLGVPGVKLGLANIVTMLLLYIAGVPHGRTSPLALTGSPTSSALTFPPCFLAMALPNI